MMYGWMDPDYTPKKGRQCRKGRKRLATFHTVLDTQRCHTTLRGVGVVGRLRQTRRNRP